MTSGRQDTTMPLANIRVVALEHAVAAPFATRQLAELGAEVIKIERLDGGDFARRYDQSVNGLSSFFVWLNRGKKSVRLNIKHPKGRHLLSRLLAEADVFVSNMTPDALVRLGLAPHQTRDTFPTLINVQISGFRPGSDWSQRKAYDLIVQGESGLMSLTGTPDRLARVGISVADIATGMYALTGILVSLLARRDTGATGNVSVNVFDSLLEWLSAPIYYTWYGGQPPARTGALHATIAPYGPYPTLDSEVILAVQNEREWISFCEVVLANPALANDPLYSSNSARVANRKALNTLVQSCTETMSSSDLMLLLDRAGIAYGTVNHLNDLVEHPLIDEAKLANTTTEVGSIQTLKPPVQFSWFQPWLGPVPGLGDDTANVLGRLGYSAEELHVLREEGVI